MGGGLESECDRERGSEPEAASEVRRRPRDGEPGFGIIAIEEPGTDLYVEVSHRGKRAASPRKGARLFQTIGVPRLGRSIVPS